MHMFRRCVHVLGVAGIALAALAQQPGPATAPTTQPAPGDPVPIEKIAGRWSGPRDITIIASGGRVTIRGQHSDWTGTYEARTGTLIATRIPTADEMDPAAPDWARAQVQGQLHWRLELRVHRVPGTYGTLRLTGKWQQGTVDYQPKEPTPDVQRQASSKDGAPEVEIEYTKVRSI